MKLLRPKKVVAKTLALLVTQLAPITRRNVERPGVGLALDLGEIATLLRSKPLQEWHATAAAQLKEHEGKRRKRREAP